MFSKYYNQTGKYTLLSISRKLGGFAMIFLVSLFSCTTNPELSESSVSEAVLPQTKDHYSSWYEEGSSLVWQFQKNGLTVYLLGSIHVGTSDLYPLNEAALKAFSDSEIIFLEVYTPNQTMELAGAYLLGEGQLEEGTLEDLLGSNEYTQLKEILLSQGIPDYFFKKSKPWVAYLMTSDLIMESNNMSGQYGIETYFTELALEFDVPILALETVVQQLSLIAGLSMEVQLELLRSNIQEFEDNARIMMQVYEYYLKNDIKGIYDKLFLETLNEEINQEYYDQFLFGRNLNWVEQINELVEGNFSPLMKELASAQDIELGQARTYMIIVGAAHLIGEQGLPTLLRQRGFTGSRL